MKKKLNVSTPSTAVASAGELAAPDRDREHGEQVERSRGPRPA